jgi:hypothetical protein
MLCFGRDSHAVVKDMLLSQVIRSFSIHDVGLSQVFVSLIAFNEAECLTGSHNLFLFFRRIDYDVMRHP